MIKFEENNKTYYVLTLANNGKILSYTLNQSKARNFSQSDYENCKFFYSRYHPNIDRSFEYV